MNHYYIDVFDISLLYFVLMSDQTFRYTLLNTVLE